MIQRSIDVDKFDYIERDCHCLGFREFPFDTERIMKCSMVINDTICFDEKVVHSIYSLFQSRFNLFQQCYSHKVGQSIGLMIRDALVEASEHIDLVNRISSPELYYRINDSIINEIYNTSKSELHKARNIINNIYCRKLYAYAGQLILTQDRQYSHITPENIAGYNPTSTNLRPEDLIVKKFKLTFGDPSKNVRFYNEFYQDNLIPKEKVSTLLSNNYFDNFVRLFVKNPEKLDAAKQAFTIFMKKEMNL